MSVPFVSASGLTKVYGRGPSAVTALADVSLDLTRGEPVAIIGKSGSGKSTLMNLIGGLDRPSAGVLSVAGSDLAGMTRSQLAGYRLRSVGFVFQSFHLIPSKTAAENVELPMVLAGRTRGERRKAAAELLDAVGLSARSGHKPAELSGGERQRVAVARALANGPQIVLADEPTGNLDSASAAAVMDLLMSQVRERGVTLILVTHDQELAARTASRVVRMRDGRVAAG